MQQPLARWLRAALIIGSGCTLAGWLLGGVLGVLLGQAWGGAVAASVVGVAAAFWGIRRVGATGLGFSIVGVAAAVLSATEVRHALVVQRPLEPFASLAVWQPGSGAGVLQVPSLELATQLGATASRPGTRRSSAESLTASPLLEGGAVVGFACGKSASRGRFALSLEAWDGELSTLCSEAIASSESRVRLAHLDLKPGASRRVVRLFASEQELRSAHELGTVFFGPAVMLALFIAGVLVVRRGRAD